MRPGLASTSFLCCAGLALVACGGRQHQLLGTGRIAVTDAPAAAATGDDGGPTPSHGEVAGQDEVPPTAAAPAGPGMVAPGTPPVGAATVALPAQSPDGSYRVRYQLWLPRAMEVTWTVRCGDHEEHGVAGESFEHYRARRVAELERERQRERERRAQVGSLVGGALLGQAQAHGAVATPGASGHATVTVDGAAAGAAAAASTVGDAPIVLAADDLGQGYRQGEVRFRLGGAVAAPDAAAACAMEVSPRDPDDVDAAAALAGSFTVERWFDARRAERVRVTAAVTTVRADLRARLVASGADPEATARRRAAEWERLRAEAAAQETLRAEAAAAAAAQAAEERAHVHARLEVEAHARLELEARTRAEVWQTRQALYEHLGRCGGNPHRRAELRAAEERQRREVAARAELRARLALDVRARLRVGLIGAGADPALAARLRAEAEARARRDAAALEAQARHHAAAVEAEARRRAAEAEARAAAELAAYEAALAEAERRAALAVHARGDVVDALVALGAVLRPPMPPPVAEVAGLPPASDARWRAGHWTWNGRQWVWVEGRWIGGGGILTVDLGVTVGGGSASWGGDERLPPGGDRAPVRDHRTPVDEPAPTRAPARDHRAGSAPPAAPAPPAPRERTRDHRTDRADDDDRDDQDARPAGGRARVRDHR